MRTRLSSALAAVIVLAGARTALATSFGYEYLISAAATTAPFSGVLTTTGDGPKGTIPASVLLGSIDVSTFAGAVGAGTADAFVRAVGSNGTIGTRLQVDGTNGSSDAHSLINYWEGFTMTSDGSVPFGGAASYTFTANLGFSGACTATGTLVVSLTIDGTVVKTGNSCQSISYDFNGTVGQQLQLMWTLDGDLSGGSSGNYFVGLDASHTLTPFINPDAPGLSYTTASGRSYLGAAPTPVPEPATLTLLGSGIAAVFGVRRRRR